MIEDVSSLRTLDIILGSWTVYIQPRTQRLFSAPGGCGKREAVEFPGAAYTRTATKNGLIVFAMLGSHSTVRLQYCKEGLRLPRLGPCVQHLALKLACTTC